MQTLWGKIENPNFQTFYGLAKNKFGVVSCQFALHYFMGNNETAQQFAKNVSNNLEEGGYFIESCFDGELVDELLKKNNTIVRKQHGEPLWAI